MTIMVNVVLFTILLLWIFHAHSYSVFHGACNDLAIPDCELKLKLTLETYPNDSEGYYMLGTLYLSQSKYLLSISQFELGLKFGGQNTNPNLYSNYIESLRITENYEQATRISEIALNQYPNHPPIIFNTAIVETVIGNHQRALELLYFVIKLTPKDIKAWILLGEILIDTGKSAEAEITLQKGLMINPDSDVLLFLFALSKHKLNKLQDAIENYQKVIQLNPHFHRANAYMAIILQTYGNVQEAVLYYEKALPHSISDVGFLNNYGCLLVTIGRQQEGIKLLQQAITINPNLQSALLNLAHYYLDELNITLAQDMFTRVYSNNPHPLLYLRSALVLSPVSYSWDTMLTERKNILFKLNDLLAMITNGSTSNAVGKETDQDTTQFDRIHFYLVYHGLNDRQIQETVTRIYHNYIPLLSYISPTLQSSLPFPDLIPNSLIKSDLTHSDDTLLPSPSTASLLSKSSMTITTATDSTSASSSTAMRKIRIGFMSKYFGVLEPHGLLLEGVMQYLPRVFFYVIALPVARTDGIPLSPAIAQAAEEIHEISLSLEHAVNALVQMRLDVLVFADVLSEPMNHFLSQIRLARIQVGFWGSPITSGSPNMDYYISSDEMEYPYRNRMTSITDPYTEQVILLEGQGIWYTYYENPMQMLQQTVIGDKVEGARVFTRADFGLKNEWFIFFCPQSVFKMHPLFDTVLADILVANPNGYLVVTGGRRSAWTTMYRRRLNKAINKNMNRVVMISRVSSEQFPALLQLANVLLHPFPFDGSKTSLDSLAAGIPFITLPSEYLRGRMGAAFYRTMNLPELVAKNRSDYINIATRLANDPTFLKYAREVIAERRHLLWEDMEVPYYWTRFLCTATGLPSISWETFLQQTTRDVSQETRLRSQRQANREAFQRVWGNEVWLLEKGKAELVEDVQDGESLRIFTDWNSSGIESHSLQDFPLRLPVAADDKIKTKDKESTTTSAQWSSQGVIKLSGIDSAINDLYSLITRITTSEGNNREEELLLRSDMMDLLLLLLLLSQFDWSCAVMNDVEQIVKSMVSGSSPMFHQLTSTTLLEMIHHLQGTHSETMTHLLLHFSSAAFNTTYQTWFQRGATQAVIAQLSTLFNSQRTSHINFHTLLRRQITSQHQHQHQDQEHTSSSNRDSSPVGPVRRIVLVIQYPIITENYLSSSPTAIKYHECINLALLQNLANPIISNIIILSEAYLNFEGFPSHHKNKIIQHVIGKEMTFQDVFAYATERLQDNIVVLTNPTISFDTSLQLLLQLPIEKYHQTLFTLHPWEYLQSQLRFLPVITSHEVWIFIPSTLNISTLSILDDFNITVNDWKCRRKQLIELFKKKNLRLLNPSMTIRAVKYDSRDMSIIETSDCNNSNSHSKPLLITSLY